MNLPSSSLEDIKLTIITFLKKKLLLSKRIQQSCLFQLKQCLSWPNLQHETLLLQANQYLLKNDQKEIELLDWETDQKKTITLQPEFTPNEQLKKRFLKIKKLKSGIPKIEKMLDHINQKITEIESNLKTIENTNDLNELLLLQKQLKIGREEKKDPNQLKKLPYYEFKTKSGLTILVGKNAKGNDILSFNVANGSDWWFHVHNYSGSHVVLKLASKNIQPDEDSIKDALQCALFYSKAKEKGEGDICMTQCKFLRRIPRGKPGQVQLSQHKIVHIREDFQRVETLRLFK